MRIPAVLVLACACVGCASADRDLSDQDQPPPPPQQQPASSAPPSPKAAPTVARNDPNEANRRLMALSEKDRRNALFVLLNSSGESCKEVVRTFYQGSDKPSGDAIWSVECRGGPSYAILVRADAKGSTEIMTCESVRTVRAGTCFVRLPD
jgi:hypothetical protein